jgi:hypothetical protein
MWLLVSIHTLNTTRAQYRNAKMPPTGIDKGRVSSRKGAKMQATTMFLMIRAGITKGEAKSPAQKRLSK